MKIEITSRIDAHIIISGEYESIKDCLERNRGAYLRGAYLGGAYLGGADLRGAKKYLNSHDIFQEVVRGQPVSLFTDSEWVAIAQITIHRLCWDTIRERFSDVAPPISSKLAEAGFGEWLEYWNKITGRVE